MCENQGYCHTHHAYECITRMSRTYKCIPAVLHTLMCVTPLSCTQKCGTKSHAHTSVYLLYKCISVIKLTECLVTPSVTLLLSPSVSLRQAGQPLARTLIAPQHTGLERDEIRDRGALDSTSLERRLFTSQDS